MTLDNSQLTRWLDTRWAAILEEGAGDADTEVDSLVHSPVASIRYAIVTQLLGKFADRSRDLLCLQRGDHADGRRDGRWDPRSFCTNIVVPWVQRNDGVLGTSADPYASKPLRRPRLDDATAVKKKAQWDRLVSFLKNLQDTGSQAEVEEALLRCLRSAARRLAKLSIDYPVPIRISLPQLTTLIDQYLGIHSGGLRPLAVTTALMRVIGEGFSLFSRVEGQGVNEADAARGMPADVMCYAPDGTIRLAVEVKDRSLTLIELQSTLDKARSRRLANVLFAVPGFASSDREAIEDRIIEEWSKGVNIHPIAISELVSSTFVLLDEGWRVRFAREVGEELDVRGAVFQDRQDWAQLLANT